MADNLGTKIVEDISAAATGQNNVFGAAANLFALLINNSLNASTTVYLKLWNHNSPTVGTTLPHMVIPCAGGQTRQYTFDAGANFAIGISYACVTGSADASTASPSAAVSIALLAT